MDVAIQKLNSKRGASIILALLFFLICSVIGSIVLFTAYASAGRLSHMKDEQQAYLTVSSAAKLVRDELNRKQYIRTNIDGTEQSPTLAGGALAGMLNSWADYIYNDNPIATEPSDEITVISGLPMDEVTATFSMDDEYDITVVLYFEDPSGESHNMTLTLSATVDEDSVTTGDMSGDTSTTTVTTTITWGSPSIVKGGA